MTNILFILSHPKKTSLNHEIYEELKEAINSKKRDQIKTIDLYSDNFNPSCVLTKEDNEDKLVLKYQKLLQWADHIIFIFPVWWFNYPAILKGFFDRTLNRGFAFEYSKSGIPKGLLTKKTSTIIRTFGGYTIERLWYGDAALKSLKKGTLNFCGIEVTQVFDLYGTNTKGFSKEKFNKFMYKVKKLKLK